MKKLLLLFFILYLGTYALAQEIEFSFQASAKKYEEISSSVGYSFGYVKKIKGNGRAKLNLIHEFGKKSYFYSGFNTDHDEFVTYSWNGDISHHNLLTRLQIDLDLTKSSKSNLYLGLHTVFGYTFIKYDGLKTYRSDLEDQYHTKNKDTFMYPNIGLNLEYEFAIDKHAFAMFFQPSFMLFKNEDLNQPESSPIENLTVGLAYRIKFKDNEKSE